MRMRFPRGRLSVRDQRLAVKGQLQGLAIMAGVPVPEYTAHIPEKRGPRKPSEKIPERRILADVLKMLRKHPHVVCCWRMQSGVFQQDDRTIRVGVVGLPDVIGMLKGGQLFAIEVKSEDGVLTGSQEYWLDTIRHFGGRAGMARSAEDAERIIGG